MSAASHLLFAHRSAHYAVAAARVSEVVWLPRLSPIEELPAQVVGAFELRGQLVAVIDLDLCFGYEPRPPDPDRCVVILELEGVPVGLIADEVIDFVSVDDGALQSLDEYRAVLGGRARFVSGAARLGGGVAMLLDIGELLRCVPQRLRLIAAGEPAGDAAAERLQRRAEQLAQLPAADAEEGAALVVFAIDEELFGIGVGSILEVAPLGRVTPAPAAPPWLLGAMGLRGQALTVIDPRPALNLAVGAGLPEQALVCGAGDARLALAVDAVLDVAWVAHGEVTAARPGSGCRGGVARWDGRSVAVLDLKTLITACEPGLAGAL